MVFGVFCAGLAETGENGLLRGPALSAGGDDESGGEDATGQRATSRRNIEKYEKIRIKVAQPGLSPRF